MNKKIVIYGGGTFSYVRSHLALSAPAFGSTAVALNTICKGRFENMDVDLRLTKMADYKSNLITNDDVAKDVDSLLQDNTTKVIFFNVAMTDYNGIIDDVPSGKHAKRLKTAKDGNPTMVLTPSDKVLNRIRKQRKDIFLVAFKTTADATDSEMFEAGLNLLKKNSCNLVLVNDIVRKENFIITPEESIYRTDSLNKDIQRLKTLEMLVDMVYHRTHLSFTRSTVVDGKPIAWEDAQIYPTLRNVIEYCINKNAYKEFNGATTGHFAAKLSDTEFLTSIRKTNFNDISKNGMVYVKSDSPNSVIAMGAKPSVGGQSQRIIFGSFKDVDCIVHFHCPLKENHRDDIKVMSQFEYECGSHECGQNTKDGLTKHGNLYAVMLDNHGPNIVFNHNIDPQEVIDFIEANFALEKSTSGFEQVYGILK